MSRAIYLSTLTFITVAITATALISLDVTIRAPGFIGPEIERQAVRNATDGVVDRVLIANGGKVKRGDTLLVLAENTMDHARLASMTTLVTDSRKRADLAILLATHFDDNLTTSDLSRLTTSQNQAIANATLIEWKQGTVQVTRTQRARDRIAQLLARGFAVPTELESADFDLARAREDRALALEQRRAAWTEALAAVEQQIVALRRDSASRTTDRSARFIIAPVAGTIENLTPMSVGTTLRSGDPIATISPTGALVAESLVSPADVAYLRVGMSARILIEGYDVQEWGAANAVVTSVASDYTVSDGRPVFRVRMHPLKEELRRPDGRTARLSMGLRGQARFVVGRRRILELLRHRASEWMDPVLPTAQ